MKELLLIPRIEIQNANALSSPYTIGFPAMTAWLGAVHALQRKLNVIDDNFADLTFKSTAVINHEFNLHTYKGHGDFNHSIVSTSNPLKKNGKRPSTIEEARCHLTVSLLIECSGVDPDEEENLLEHISSLLHRMKMASGDILSFKAPYLKTVGTEQETKQLMAKLMPGFCLIERRDLVQQSMQQGLDGMDAVLESLKVNSNCEVTKGKEDQKDTIEWTQTRQQAGWIVPIAVGFQGVTDLAIAKHQRDTKTPHRFAESVVTLGEFIMPSRIEQLDNMLWHYAELENDLYCCKQNQPIINLLEQ